MVVLQCGGWIPGVWPGGGGCFMCGTGRGLSVGGRPSLPAVGVPLPTFNEAQLTPQGGRKGVLLLV